MDASERNSLADLLAATATGDRDAFARVYRLTSAKLFGVALNMLKRRDLAEEVLQDAYVQVWKNAAAYSPERGLPMAWLVGIVRYRALDRLRRSPADSPLDDAPDSDSWIDPSPTPLEDSLKSAERRALLACLGKLEAQRRRCILMAFYDGYTHQELADRFDAPLGTVKSWIRRGLITLKECLEG